MIEQYLIKLGSDVRQLRLLKGFSRQTVCDKARISVRALRNLESNGQANIETLIRVVVALDRTSWLFSLSPEISINPLDMPRGKSRVRGRKAVRQCQPKWLYKKDLTKIKSIYEKASRKTKKTGIVHTVDHIVPILGDNVSGLHVPWNLRVITKVENDRKSNKF
jgi:transcriptional regulator with XRE-family HTH domain